MTRKKPVPRENYITGSELQVSFRVVRHVRQDTIRYVRGPRTTIVNYRNSRRTRIYYIYRQIGSVSYYANWPIAFNIRASCAPVRRSFSTIGVPRHQDV